MGFVGGADGSLPAGWQTVHRTVCRGTAVLPPCSTPQQLTEHQNKNTRRGTAGAFILVELTGVEPVAEKKAVRVSPGAVHLLKFPQCERVHTLDTLVAS